ncbi:acyl-coenzyme A amino acid N-acyltransferase 2-like isoform X1 [Acanthochromis polyacanthus]|uniref:acyl-coenzyme A amino acid N-acyltransferase 2-like isoform X1 n=1 Tax=Acanthochromis polyacanthus TaxID=80966 RepID=UPI0022342C5F|nr:acyl-coenzyme A amino acid N-acyltransferase 2-like isoform X1 [Acanthochromis polyacanthus]
MHLDHFEEAVNFLKWHSKVGSKGIGVISRSKGGDIALSIAAFVSGFEAVVCIGCNANVFFPLYYNKRLLLQPILSCYKKLISSVSGTVNDKYILDNHLEENNDALIPTELAKGQFLFVASEDDLSWDSKTYMDQMVERLKRHGKDNFESVCYPGAGHLLEPPYGPHCRSSCSWFSDRPFMWGGVAKCHAAAEVHMWRKIQEFFRTHLSCDVAQNKIEVIDTNKVTE